MCEDYSITVILLCGYYVTCCVLVYESYDGIMLVVQFIRAECGSILWLLCVYYVGMY